jgi:phosphoribosylformylglycinamidine synthase subunit PurQ / glutaminase
VLGICNGFQVLLEAGLLPGAMLRNASLRFICRFVHVRVENATLPFTQAYHCGQILDMPIAHNAGNYYVDAQTLDAMERHEQIAFRYCAPDGEITAAANPNGSLDNIAGVCNERGNVLGLMPHPERCAEEMLSSSDGRPMFTSMLHAATARLAAA